MAEVLNTLLARTGGIWWGFYNISEEAVMLAYIDVCGVTCVMINLKMAMSNIIIGIK